MLFGEVIDISELIPRTLSPSADTPPLLLPVVEAVEAEFGALDAGDLAATSSHAAGALTILYDDGILASDDAIL